jgi:hypothetical protein
MEVFAVSLDISGIWSFGLIQLMAYMGVRNMSQGRKGKERSSSME